MSITSIIAAASIAATALIAPPPQGDVSTTGSVERVISSTYSGAGWWSRNIPEHRCPAEAQHLSNTDFHPGSGWGLPRGVELVVTNGFGTIAPGDAQLTVNISPILQKGDARIRLGAGGWDSTISSWAHMLNRTVTVKVHCTSAP